MCTLGIVGHLDVLLALHLASTRTGVSLTEAGKGSVLIFLMRECKKTNDMILTGFVYAADESISISNS